MSQRDLTPAGTLSLLSELDRTQWLGPADLAELQWRRLAEVVEHAGRTVPFYRRRLRALGRTSGSTVGPDDWPAVPIITRAEAQRDYQKLVSTALPPEHGRTFALLTSGSTGRPLRTQSTEFTNLYWRSITLRDHSWHERDFTQKLAVIRQVGGPSIPRGGNRSANWGVATFGAVDTGPGVMLGIEHTVAEQAEWLRAENPGYLLTYPSNAMALAQHCSRLGIELPGLLQVRTFGEVLDPQVRPAVEAAWGASVVDMYSSQEVGYVALQCPTGTNYHVQSESVMVEVLDGSGHACRPGEVGRVVVSTLNNFATPLLRYDIGDFAEVGEACPCGRGLPTLTRILGRQRNMFVLPDGDRFWPTLDHPGEGRSVFGQVPRLLQFQFIQHEVERIEMRLVPERRFTAEEEALMHGYLQSTFGYRFRLDFVYVDEIPRSAGGKFEDFRSEVRL